jgi:hypothetical protein
MALGELNDGLYGATEGREASPSISIASGKYRPAHFGFNFGGEWLIYLAPRLALGLGAEIIHVTRESNLEIYYAPKLEPSMWYLDTAKPAITAVPLSLNIHANVLTRGSLSLDASSGISYYLGRIGYNYLSKRKDGADSSEDDWRANSGTFGLQAGIGLEYLLGPSTSFFIEALGRYARLKNLKGELTADGVLAKDAYLWFCQSDSFSMIIIDDTEPDWRYGEARKATVDLSGISLRVGVKIRIK